jgi:Bacterial HORMA domain 2
VSYVSVNTRTYTATYIATNVMRGFKRLVQGCGLDVGQLHWPVVEGGLAQLLGGQWLNSAVLEVYDPTRTGALVGRFDFDINYSYSADSDGALWMDPDTVNAVIRKNGSYPSRCAYSILCSSKTGAPTPAGWVSTTFRSTDGMVRHSVGTAIGAGSVGAGLAYYKRVAS